VRRALLKKRKRKVRSSWVPLRRRSRAQRRKKPADGVIVPTAAVSEGCDSEKADSSVSPGEGASGVEIVGPSHSACDVNYKIVEEHCGQEEKPVLRNVAELISVPKACPAFQEELDTCTPAKTEVDLPAEKIQNPPAITEADSQSGVTAKLHSSAIENDSTGVEEKPILPVKAEEGSLASALSLPNSEDYSSSQITAGLFPVKTEECNKSPSLPTQNAVVPSVKDGWASLQQRFAPLNNRSLTSRAAKRKDANLMLPSGRKRNKVLSQEGAPGSHRKEDTVSSDKISATDEEKSANKMLLVADEKHACAPVLLQNGRPAEKYELVDSGVIVEPVDDLFQLEEDDDNSASGDRLAALSSTASGGRAKRSSEFKIIRHSDGGVDDEMVPEELGPI
jgi:hypothetical protein